MSGRRVVYGLHAVTAALKQRPGSVFEVFLDAGRNDPRARRVVDLAKAAGVRLHETDAQRIEGFAKGGRHQGVAAFVEEVELAGSLNEVLDDLAEPAFLLILDGVQDPHNLGACLRVADGAGAHAVVAPKDHAVGLNATVAKVASGAAETVPYFMVTNLARTLNELKERDIRIVGTAEDAPGTIYDADLSGPVALVFGAEGSGMRQLTAKTCDELAHLPMQGAVESLNVSVASGVCLYEAARQRRGGGTPR